MSIVIHDVSVVPMDSERVIRGQTVIIHDDRIAWIGAADDANPPTGAVRVDGRGKYLMPGLADMHCHPGSEDELLLCVAFGVTTIRNLEGMPRHLLWRRRIVDGELLGPMIHTTGPVVDGRPARCNGMQSVVERDEAVAAVTLTERGGYDAIKVYDQLSVEAYGWVVDVARDRGIPVVGHIPFAVGLHGALSARQRSIEHLYGYPQAVQSVRRNATGPRDLTELRAWLFDMALHADSGRITELAEATKAAGTWNCPTLLVRTRWAEDAEAVLARPEMAYVSPMRAAQARHFMSHYPTEPARQALIDLNGAIVRGLDDAGAGLLIGTDAGLPGVLHGAAVHEELKAFVDAGLSPYRALRAATRDAATFLGEGGEWGEISVGARADVLLVDGNPLEDVTNVARLAGVMVRGRWLPDSEIAALLDDLAVRQQSPNGARSAAQVVMSTSSNGERLRFRVTWGTFDVGAEEIVDEPQAGGGRHIVSSMSTDGGMGTENADAGTYRGSVAVDAAGVDQSAWFECEANDGLDRVELTRTDGRVTVRHAQPVGAEQQFVIDDPEGSALFGRPHTALYLRLAERLVGMEVGDEMDVPVIGPALAPDFTVQTGTLRAVRLPSTEDGTRYAVEYRRPNWTIATLLVCDRRDRPVRLEHGSDMSYWERNASAADPDPASLICVSRAGHG